MTNDIEDPSVEDSWRDTEMRLAARRKDEWLKRRGRVGRWFVEPWPVPHWLHSYNAGLLIGAALGFLLGVIVFA